MAAFSAIALGIGAAASVVGTVGAMKAQRQQADAQEKSFKAQQQQEQLRVRRSRRQAIREAQLKRASALVSAQGAGAAGSSGAMGGIGALGSQLGETIGFSNQYSGLSDVITRSNIEQNRAAAKGQLFGSIAQLGGQAMSYGFSQGKTFRDLVPNRPPMAQARVPFIS